MWEGPTKLAGASQFEFGQCECVLCVSVCVSVLCCTVRGWPLHGVFGFLLGPPLPDRPSPYRPFAGPLQISLFFPSPAANFICFFSLLVRGIVVAIHGRIPTKVQVWAPQGSLCATPAACRELAQNDPGEAQMRVLGGPRPRTAATIERERGKNEICVRR